MVDFCDDAFDTDRSNRFFEDWRINKLGAYPADARVYPDADRHAQLQGQAANRSPPHRDPKNHHGKGRSVWQVRACPARRCHLECSAGGQRQRTHKWLAQGLIVRRRALTKPGLSVTPAALASKAADVVFRARAPP
jgi:hypothetical protein